MSFFKKLADKAEELFDGDDKKDKKPEGQGQGTSDEQKNTPPT